MSVLYWILSATSFPISNHEPKNSGFLMVRCLPTQDFGGLESTRRLAVPERAGLVDDLGFIILGILICCFREIICLRSNEYHEESRLALSIHRFHIVRYVSVG